jgi:putative DNA primase/helicase
LAERSVNEATTTSPGTTTIEAVQKYIGAGFAPIPVPARSKNPNRQGWQQERVTLEDIPRLWNNGQNVGILNGAPSGWTVDVDLDCALAVKLAGCFLEPTLTSGRETNPESHWWYYCENIETQSFCDIDGRKKLIELRSTGSQTLVAPSVHPSDGDRYVWCASGLEIARVDRGKLLRQIRLLASAVLVGQHLPPTRANGGGGRHDYALALAGFLQRHGLSEEDTLNILVAAWDRATDWPNGSTWREARRDLKGIVRDTARNLADNRSVKGGRVLGQMVPGMPKTLGRYWGRGHQPDEERQQKKKDKKRTDGGAEGRGTGEEDEAPTHDELRDRWLEANPDYAYGLEEWRRYDSGIWPGVKTPVVRKSMVRVLEGAKEEGIRPSVFVLNSVHALAQVETYVPDERWDADPNIIVAENGAINIKTGSLGPHSSEHYATIRVPYAFDPDAEATNWRKFIGDLDKDVASFLQEFAGYCLTTDTSLEKAVWLIGPPGGGKSTYLEGLLAMLGERAGVLGLAEIEKTRFSLAKLAGKTLVTAAEQPGGYLSTHHILNAIISGEPIQVERKHRDPYDLTARAKIAWAMNELPRIPSGAEGLFRRVEVIKFNEIPLEGRDPKVKEGIKAEGAGVLNWALEGLQELRSRGRFEVPQTVADATESFKKHNDAAAQFVEERCDIGKDLEVKASELYADYKHWCEDTGHGLKSSTSIAQDWERLGFEKAKRKSGNFWRGVDLKENTRWVGR